MLDTLKTYLRYASFFLRVVRKITLVAITLFVVVSLFFYLSAKDKPQTQNIHPIELQRQQIYAFMNDLQKDTDKMAKLKIALYRMSLCGFIGETCSTDPKSSANNYHKSLLGSVAGFISLPYANPPASGIMWAYDGFQNAGLIPKTYAAGGIGFASISAFSKIWVAFRNLTYLIMVVVIIIIGFMIMFRMKLNPQTVISIENALPKIIVTMLLINFSYAIVGFAIDAMYLLTILGIQILGTAAGIPDIQATQSSIVTSNIFAAGNGFDNIGTYVQGIYGIVGMLDISLQGAIYAIITLIAIFGVARLSKTVGDFISDLLGEFTAGLSAILDIKVLFGKIVGALIGLLVFGLLMLIIPFFVFLLIAVLGLLFLMFRIMFLLLSALIQVILNLIFAPLFIIFGAIPGLSSISGFGSWFRKIVGNLAVFPIVVLLLYMTQIITKMYNPTPVPHPVNYVSGVFMPPLLSGFNANVLSIIINAVLLMSIPDLAKAIRQLIVGKEGLQIPASPAALFGSVGAVGGSAMGLLGTVNAISLGLGALGYKPKNKQDQEISPIAGLYHAIRGK